METESAKPKLERAALLDALSHLQWLLDQGYQNIIPLPDLRRWAGIRKMAFTHAVLIGRIGDRIGHDDRFCYATYEKAKAGMDDWVQANCQGEPQGWHRHPNTGRRRPGGDPAGQYIEW